MRTILLILFLAVVASADTLNIHIERPGLGGMVSNFDIVGTSTLEQARYLLNMRTELGALERRYEIDSMGGNTTLVYGADGLYDEYNRWKAAVAVARCSTSHIGQFVHTDTFGLTFDNFLSPPLFAGRDIYHGWLSHNSMLLHYDNQSVPRVFLTESTFEYEDTLLDGTDDNPPDSLGYGPRLLSIGNEAPGQPCVSLTDTGLLTGDYEYRFRHCVARKEYVAVPSHDTIYYDLTTGGYPGPASVTAYARSQNVVISCLALFPRLLYFASSPIYDYFDTTHWPQQLIIERRNLSGRSNWKHVTVFEVTSDSSYYVDSVADADLEPLLAYVDTTLEDRRGPRPGQISYKFNDSDITTSRVSLETDDDSIKNSTGLSYLDSLYNLAYSFYDPVTGIESPLGPALYGRLGWIDTVADSTAWGRIMRFPYTPDWQARHIRVYQGITETGYLGAGDTTNWYLLFQFRANQLMDSTSTDFYPGWWSDGEVAVGLDSSHLNVDTIYNWMLPKTYYGDPIFRPPYVYSNDKMFGSMAKTMGRVFGTAERGCPTCVYYSEIDSLHLWPPENYIDLSTDRPDEAVAVVRAVGGEACYVFLHNDIYILYGDDPIFDFYAKSISRGIGAVSRELIASTRDSRGQMVTYFMSPQLKLYSLTGGGPPVEISQPIENWIDSIFESYGTAQTGRAFVLGDAIKWTNSAGDSKHLSFNFTTGQWSLEQYEGALDWRGSFKYDSSTTRLGFPEYSDLLFMDSALPLRAESQSNVKNDDSYIFAWAYQTPFFGDGEQIWKIHDIQLTAVIPGDGDTTRWAKITWRVFNEKNENVVDNFVLLNTDNTSDIIVEPDAHEFKWGSLRLFANANDSLSSNAIFNQAVISDVRIKLISQGKSPVSDTVHIEITGNPWEAHDTLGNPSQ